MDALDELLAPPGHNNPPTADALRDELFKLESEPLVKRKNELIASAGRVPETIRGKDAAGGAADLVKMIIACQNAAEAVRTTHKAPVLSAGRFIDRHLGANVVTALDNAKRKILGKLERFLAAYPDLDEVRGEVSLLRRQPAWTFDEYDRDALDLEALRQHLPTDAIEKAIRSFIKAGGRDLRGVRIYERQEARVS